MPGGGRMRLSSHTHDDGDDVGIESSELTGIV